METVVVNAHWQADRWRRTSRTRDPARAPSCGARPRCWRPAAACKAALDLLGPAPFFVVNGDAFWLDGPRPALARLAAAFDPGEVDGVLLVHRTFQVQADVGLGDFAAGPVGRAAPARASARWHPTSMPACSSSHPRCSPARRTGLQHEPGLGHRDGGRPAARRGA